MSADTIDRPNRDPADPARHSRGLRATAIWTLACLLVLLWWGSHYTSFVERLAEWQFAVLGRYYPTMTVVVVVLLLSAPVAALVAWRRHRQRRRAERVAGGVDPVRRADTAIASAVRGQVFFASVAIVSGLVAVVTVLAMLSLPRGQGAVRTIAGTANSVQPEGPARYAAEFTTGRIARIEENVGLARRVMYVAPVRLAPGTGGGTGGGAHFLTELDRLPPPGLRFRPIASGVLVSRGLPRELTNLYREVDVVVPDTAYLLVRDGATVRWRSVVLAVQTALLSIVALAIALLFRRQARRLRATVARAGATGPSTPA